MTTTALAKENRKANYGHNAAVNKIGHFVYSGGHFTGRRKKVTSYRNVFDNAEVKQSCQTFTSDLGSR